MDRPFFILAIALMMGILFSFYFNIGLFTILLCIFIFILIILYNIAGESTNSTGIILLFFALGILLYNINDSSALRDGIDNRMKYRGTIIDVLNKDEEQSRYMVLVDEMEGKKIPKEKLILKIIGKDTFEIGERIEFTGKTRIPPRNTNPKLFNYRLNLMTEKVFVIMTIKEDAISSIEQGMSKYRYEIKRKSIEKIEELFHRYLDEENSSIIKSIMLGKSTYLEDEVISIYRGMGLAHILAVSGLHIGIISGFFMFVFSHLGIKKRNSVAIVLSMLWIYGYIIGFPPSILRANIMLCLLYYSQLIYKPYDSINILSFAGFVLMLINPYYLFNIGFQLSFLATLSILILSPKIEHIFYPHKNYMTRSISTILGVLVGIFPIQIYYFNGVSLMGILANILIVPILSISLILSFLMLIFDFASIGINSIIGPVLNFILSFQFNVLRHLSSIGYGMIKFPSPEVITIIWTYIIIGIIFKIIDISKLKRSTNKIILVYLSMILVHNLYISFYQPQIELHFIDVGQGDSLLIRGRGKDYLIDTGGSIFGDFDIGENITLPYLEKLGVRKLDAVFITHFDEDHSQGLEALIPNIPIDIIFSSYIPVDNNTYEMIVKDSVPFSVLRKGDRLALDRDMNMEIIWPDKDIGNNHSPNNLSLVSILNIGRYKVLLCGDIEEDGEYSISKEFNTEVDIIKVPHHGSKTSSTEEFLKVSRPKIGIISVGRNNIYGHPNEEVLNRYIDFNTQLYRTDEMGMIKIIFQRDNYRISTFLDNGEREKIKFYIFVYENMEMIIFYVLYYMSIYMVLRNRYKEGGKSI